MVPEIVVLIAVIVGLGAILVVLIGWPVAIVVNVLLLLLELYLNWKDNKKDENY